MIVTNLLTIVLFSGKDDDPVPANGFQAQYHTVEDEAVNELEHNGASENN